MLEIKDLTDSENMERAAGLLDARIKEAKRLKGVFATQDMVSFADLDDDAVLVEQTFYKDDFFRGMAKAIYSLWGDLVYNYIIAEDGTILREINPKGKLIADNIIEENKFED